MVGRGLSPRGWSRTPVSVPVILSLPEESHNPPMNRKLSGSYLLSSQAHQASNPKATHSVLASRVSFVFKNHRQAYGMAQWGKAFAIKPDNLSLFPKTYMVEGEIRPQQLSSDPFISAISCPPPANIKKYVS